MKEQPPIITIDDYSLASLYIEAYFNDQFLSNCSGFTWVLNDGRVLLVSNWHCFSGRHFFTREVLDKTHAGVPNKLVVYFRKENSTNKELISDVLRPADIFILDNQGTPGWNVHGTLGADVDIAAITVPANILAGVKNIPLNRLASHELSASIGQDVFIVGYPFRNQGKPGSLPIWKRGSIASDPGAVGLPRRWIWYDTTSRPGMSGSFILRRDWGYATTAGGGVAMFSGKLPPTRVVGIYSGRVGAAGDDAQLGIGWPIEILEAVARSRRDDPSTWKEHSAAP